MAVTTNDGGVPFGSQIITVGATTFVAENITYNEPSTLVERRDETGTPTGQVMINNFDNGTATLQLAATPTVPPTRGATFTLTRNGGATIACFFSEISEVEGQSADRKVTIQFRRKYN